MRATVSRAKSSRPTISANRSSSSSTPISVAGLTVLGGDEVVGKPVLEVRLCAGVTLQGRAEERGDVGGGEPADGLGILVREVARVGLAHTRATAGSEQRLDQ